MVGCNFSALKDSENQVTSTLLTEARMHLTYRVCARRPCWRSKTIKRFSFGKKFNSHAKIFLLFTPPTWPPHTDSIIYVWVFTTAIQAITIYQWGFMALSKCPRKAEFLVLKGQKMRPSLPLKFQNLHRKKKK